MQKSVVNTDFPAALCAIKKAEERVLQLPQTELALQDLPIPYVGEGVFDVNNTSMIHRKYGQNMDKTSRFLSFWQSIDNIDGQNPSIQGLYSVQA